ncbi:hypothetical protein ONZ45_g6452 [Pleurotus djamor]|nr:hypothetical protein ONZ45_g6452 [Pleurotus djamor]
MSSLQELNLIKGTLSIPLPPLPHLKRLLIDPTELLTGHLSDHVLLQSLQNTPNLEELRVLKVAVAMLDESLPLVVDLPCLTHLSSDLLHLLGALTHFTSLPGRIIREVGVTTQDEFLLTLEGVHQSPYPTPYRFELTLKGPVDFQDEISAILGVVPMSKVSTLRLTGIAPGTIQPRRLFERCGEVKHLHLTACAVEVFSGLKNANDSTLALPNLRTLSVERCKFTYSNGGRNSKLCKAMTSFLEKRRRLNAVIEEFSICACDITGSVIKEFEELVDVEWDYQEVEDED